MFAYFLLLFKKCLNICQAHLRESKTFLCVTVCQCFSNPVAQSLWVGSCWWCLYSSIPAGLQGNPQGTALAVGPHPVSPLCLAPITCAAWLLCKLAASWFWELNCWILVTYCLQGPYPNCIFAAEDRLGCWAKPHALQALGRQPDNFRGSFHSFRQFSELHVFSYSENPGLAIPCGNTFREPGCFLSRGRNYRETVETLLQKEVNTNTGKRHFNIQLPEK